MKLVIDDLVKERRTYGKKYLFFGQRNKSTCRDL